MFKIFGVSAIVIMIPSFIVNLIRLNSLGIFLAILVLFLSLLLVRISN